MKGKKKGRKLYKKRRKRPQKCIFFGYKLQKFSPSDANLFVGQKFISKEGGGNYQNAKYISLYKADIRFLSAIFPEIGGGRLDAPRQSAAVSGQYKPKHRRSIKSRPLIFVFVPIKHTMKQDNFSQTYSNRQEFPLLG